MTDESPVLFMTGVTGFLGTFILRDLLARGRRLAVLLRPPADKAVPRLAELMRPLGVDVDAEIAAGRIIPAYGSLPAELPEPTWGRTAAVLHNAASLQLMRKLNGEPYRTNVEGTDALIRWVDRHGITELHAVSTAFACGSYTDDVAERFHHPEPEFKTDYEKSKWQSECRFEQWATTGAAGGSGRVLTVYRPAFLVGDSKTGYSTQFTGFYQLGRLAHVMSDMVKDQRNGKPVYIPLRVPGDPDAPQHFVPVDFAARMVVEAMCRPEMQGRIYHIVHPDPPTNDLILKYVGDFYNLYGGRFVKPDELNGNKHWIESAMFSAFGNVVERMLHTPRFVCPNLRNLMEVSGVPFPSMDRACYNRLLDYAEQCGWASGSKGMG